MSLNVGLETTVPRHPDGSIDLAAAFRGLAIFEDVAEEAVREIARFSRVCASYRGQTLMEEGEASSDLIVLLTARVEVQVASISPYIEIGLCKLGPGECVGEMGIIEDTVRSATVVSQGPGDYAVIPAAALKEFLAARPEVGVLVMRNVSRILSKRLQTMNRRVMNFMRARYL